MASSGFSKLSRKHGFKIGDRRLFTPCSVEEVAFDVGEIIGHSSVKSAVCGENRTGEHGRDRHQPDWAV
ncbi:hypothetical protein JOB18_015047 [Solea senegalensis]|uniref:Uncharacterized protein n=1 Tax=Solea senegalensis TaxID=28829 RepID=A0AAV6QX16_SOLSE|nr:hypothetical protein JOB18_015047 [Solea senegalensis]